MITSLRINNIALIEENIIKLSEGFNALTGETGAGKSIIVDSLNFVLGSKADKNLIKSGKNFAKVEVVFELPALNEAIIEFFNSINSEPETTIIISRFYDLNGKNEIRVNGEAVTLSMLKKLTVHLVDIHGQHDHQSLLDVKNHIKIIDSLSSEIPELLSKLKCQLDSLKNINNQISSIGGEGEEKLKNIQLLEYEIKEIELAELQIGEDELLSEKRKLFANSEKLTKSLNEAYSYLNSPDYGVANQIKSATYSLNAISHISEKIEDLKNRLNASLYELNDVADSINTLLSSVEYDEDEVNEVEERIDLIKDLKRKYGSTIENIYEYLKNAQTKLFNLKNSEEALNKLNKEKSVVLKQIFEICNSLTNLRKKTGESIKNNLIKELGFLGIKNAKFEIKFNNDYLLSNIENKVTSSGADNIEFLFSANPGVEVRPLSKIISGGELSRFMLAFKCVIQENSGIKTLVFDEIDAGIGGRIGLEVGKKIATISKFNQVVCITHLAQIAVFADSNFKIEKTTGNDYTTSSTVLLNENGKIKEIARMLGLNEEAVTGEASAVELISFAEEFKNKL